MEKHKSFQKYSHSQRFFTIVSLKFSDINNRRVTSAHVAIRLSFMQLIDEYLLSKRCFDYCRSLGYKRPIKSNKLRHVDVMNVASGLKLHDLILSFLLLSRTNNGSKTFFRSLWKVWVLCDFLNLSCLRIIATSRQS